MNGHVIDAKTREHLPFVTVVIKGTTIGITTDATGHYFLKDMPVGEFTLVASYVGYRPAEKTVRIEARTTIEVNFELEEESLALSEVVVSATRNETKKQESGIIVNVLSAKLFEAVSSSNLAETMCFQPGLRVENNCGNCGTTQLRINGLEGQYSQILMDSRPVFSSLAAVYGLEQLPVDMIERIEVIRGGGSALFGASAIGGVVNIITKEPLRNSLSIANATNFIGESGALDMNTSINGSFVSDDHKAGVYVFGIVKDRSAYDHNGDGFSDIPTIKSETVGFKGYYRTGLYSKLTAEYHHIREMRRGGNHLELPPHQADIAEYLNHNINGGGITFSLFSPDYKHRLALYSSAQGINRDSYFAAEKGTDNYGNTSDRTFVAGSQYTLAFHGPWAPAELTAGLEYTHNRMHDSFVALSRDIRQTSATAGGFVQNEWKSQRFGLLLGARLDKHNLMSRPVFSPRGTLRFNPSDVLNFRASYSSGYRAPQAYNEDLHIEAVGGVLGLIELAPDLKPEYSHSISASADFYHTIGRLQTNVLAEAFFTSLNHVFTLEKTGTDSQGNIIYTRRNATGARVQGVNIEAKAALPGRFDMQIGYTLQQSRYTQPEQWSDKLAPQRKMFRAPDSYGYFVTNLTLSHKLQASVFGNYTGAMLVKHTVNGTDSERQTPGFFDMGLKVAWHFHLGKVTEAEISGGIKNMLNSFQDDLDYGPGKDAAYVYGPAAPRTLFLGLKFSL